MWDTHWIQSMHAVNANQLHVVELCETDKEIGQNLYYYTSEPEIAVDHRPFSDQFQDLAEQN